MLNRTSWVRAAAVAAVVWGCAAPTAAQPSTQPAAETTKAPGDADRGTLSGAVFGATGRFVREHVIQGRGRVENQGVFGGAGAAVEWQPLPMLAVGADGGWVIDNGHPAPLLGVGAVGYFRDGRRADVALAPFVTGGWSWLVDFDPLMYVGAGATRWLRNGAGIRVELRHHAAVAKPRLGGFTRWTEVRIGVAFGRRRLSS